jgi:CRP-like cAMP-binding protein
VLLTIERVALLRRVQLFADTPDRVLAGLAQVLQEVEVSVGETLIEQGAVEDWLYVVADGRLEILRDDHRAEVTRGGVVGELAVLDPKPRSARVVATEPSLVLMLTKPAFDEVISTRPEIAAGVIRELVLRLRERQTAPTRSPGS